MSRISVLTPDFVEYIPAETREGVLYISIPFATATHRCACGCGNVVVTPLTPTDWRLTFDGETVSLNPSIGNWSFLCRSHYWIANNRVRWASAWSDAQVEAGRVADRRAKRQFFAERPTGAATTEEVRSKRLMQRLKEIWRRFSS